MADIITSLLQLNLQETGGNDSTWGEIANTNFSRLEQAVSGSGSLSLTGGLVTPTDDQLRPALLILTGSTPTDFQIPDARPRVWMVTNAGAAMAFFRTASAPGTRVRIAPNQTEILVSDGVQTSKITNGPPVGSIGIFTYVPPTGGPWFEQDGRLLNRSDYFELFEVIGTAYGAGDNVTTFGIGNCQDAYIRGRGTSAVGTALADQIKGHGHEVVMDAGGDHTHGASVTITYPAHTYKYPNATAGTGGNGSPLAWQNTAGGDQSTTPPNPTNPTITVNSAGSHVHANAAALAGAETETRPRSLVYTVCIKAF